MLTVQGVLAAPAALQDLAQAAAWTVLQVHPDACNLVAEPNRLVALVRPQVGAGPFSVVVELEQGFDQCVQPGEHVQVRGGELHLSGLAVQLEYARPWQPRPNWEVLRAARTLPRWLDLLAEVLRLTAPRGSLAEGLDAMLVGSEAAEAQAAVQAVPGEIGGQVLRAAMAGGQALIDAVARADLETAGRAAGALAGLGTGLTPSGDDFLVGGMLALWSTAEPEWSSRAGHALSSAAGPRTHRLSRAWLAAAARGEAAEAWHALVGGLIEDDGPAVRGATERIIRQGHTSGADSLTGFLAVASKTAPGTGAA